MTADRPTRARRAAGERGSVALLSVWVAALLVAAAAAALVWGAALIARHRAARIADLSALAAAAHRLAGGDGCATAARVASAAGGRVTGCQDLVDGSVLVVVAVPTVHCTLLGRPVDVPPARARARAGVAP